MSARDGGGRRRRVLVIASIAAAVVVAGGAATAVTLTEGNQNHNTASRSGSPSRVVSATPSFKAAAAVTPPVAVSECTTTTAFTYSGTLYAAVPGTVKYQWVYSSGKPGPVRTVSFPSAGRKLVTGETVKSETSGGGWGEIKMISPVARTSNEATYKLLCGDGSVGGVTATATVTPAAMTVSCVTAPPRLTASGSIRASKAEKVTYHWALSDGANSAPATLTFTKPGTQAAEPLTITPPGASGSGAAVLVVTSPVTTASRPATYTLTCKAPTTQPAANQTAPPATSQTVSATASASARSQPTYTPVPLPQPTMTIVGGTLNSIGTIGTALQVGTAVEGGLGPYSWSVTGLPSGLTTTTQDNGSALLIIGTPATAGAFPITVTVRDSQQTPQVITRTYTITISPKSWDILTPDLPDGTVGTPYAATVAASSDVTVSWSASGLPAGLSINPVTGTISGTPTTPCFVGVSVSATVTQAGAGTTTKTATYDVSIKSAAVATPTPTSTSLSGDRGDGTGSSFPARGRAGPGRAAG